MKKSLVYQIKLIWLFVFMTPFLIVSLFLFSYSPVAELMILTSAAMFYIALALLHHQKEKTLTVEVMVEYFLIALLSVIVFFNLVF